MNIWQIQQELLSIFDELEENGGELTEELEQQLAISQEDFRAKVESYTNVIKTIKTDIAAIDQESKRLAELKKSKTAIIERLSKVIIGAVEMFGDTTKTGGKFFDYGTGKVSIRNSQKVELDESKVDAIGDEFGKAFAVEAMLGNASNRESFTVEDMVQRCKEHKLNMVDAVLDDPQDINGFDLENTNVDITISKPILSLFSGDGYKLMKDIAMFTSDFKIVPKADKTSLKNCITCGNEVNIGTVVSNQTLTIK